MHRLGVKIILLLQASHLVLDVSSNPKQGWVVTACCPVEHTKCNLLIIQKHWLEHNFSFFTTNVLTQKQKPLLTSILTICGKQRHPPHLSKIKDKNIKLTVNAMITLLQLLHHSLVLRTMTKHTQDILQCGVLLTRRITFSALGNFYYLFKFARDGKIFKQFKFVMHPHSSSIVLLEGRLWELLIFPKECNLISYYIFLLHSISQFLQERWGKSRFSLPV